MKQTTSLKICKFISGIGPAGNLPASGTWGAAIALPFAWLLIDSIWLPGLTLLSFIIGIWAIYPLIKNNSDKDPSYVIIDEFMGQLFVFCFVPAQEMNILTLIFGFLFFRTFDILKPWPASFFDKKIHSSFGVMMDDLVAAFYAIISLAFTLIISYKI